MIAQAWKTCKVHHRSSRLLVEIEQAGQSPRASERRPGRGACPAQNASLYAWGLLARRFPLYRRPSSIVPMALPLVVRLTSISLLYSVLYTVGFPPDRRLVLADAGDRVPHLPLSAARHRPSHDARRSLHTSQWGISLAALQWWLISQQCMAGERSGRRPGWGEQRSGRHGARATTRKSPAPGGAHRPRWGPSSLQRGPPARSVERAAPGTPTSIMARLWVTWECVRGTLSLAAPRATHTARPYACLPGGSAMP